MLTLACYIKFPTTLRSLKIVNKTFIISTGGLVHKICAWGGPLGLDSHQGDLWGDWWGNWGPH